MRIAVAKLRHAEAAGLRPKGYASQVIASGKLIDPETLEISDDQFNELARKYRGLGDVVAAIAKPIAGAIDAVLGTDIQNCGGCQQRQEELNKAIPFS